MGRALIPLAIASISVVAPLHVTASAAVLLVSLLALYELVIDRVRI